MTQKTEKIEYKTNLKSAGQGRRQRKTPSSWEGVIH